MKFGRKNRRAEHNAQSTPPVQTVSRDKAHGAFSFAGFEAQTKAERELYVSLRNSVPIIDAAISKIVRLIGRFTIETADARCQSIADSFVEGVLTNGSGNGLNGFIYTYFDSLLTCGEAVGEMIPDRGLNGIAALYNASLDDVVITADKSPLNLTVCVRDGAKTAPVRFKERVFATLLNPKPGTIRGTSILSGLPFVSSVLLRIFESIKTNWERAGDIRFAVTCNTPPGGQVMTKENAKLIADEWKKAMRSDSVCDFVSAGDVSIKVIGAENMMPDCDVPIRHILEQIIAKLGVPPFLLGITWSSTERMSVQQADILTSELEHYRTAVEPVIRKIVGTHLRLCGFGCPFKICWNDINLQDAVELSQARLNNATAAQIEAELNKTQEDVI